MNLGSRRSDGVFTERGALAAERGALAMVGLGTCAGGVRAALLVRVADGADRAVAVVVAVSVAVTVAVARASAVVADVEEKGLDVAVLMEATGIRNVGALAPAQPAKVSTSAVAPARE
jgi:hypothetical protein